jgi:hypothetical protein
VVKSASVAAQPARSCTCAAYNRLKCTTGASSIAGSIGDNQSFGRQISERARPAGSPHLFGCLEIDAETSPVADSVSDTAEAHRRVVGIAKFCRLPGRSGLGPSVAMWIGRHSAERNPVPDLTGRIVIRAPPLGVPPPDPGGATR